MSLLSRFRALIQQRKLDAILDEEMRSHLEMRTEANIAGGMSPTQARADAVRRFGNRAVVKEEMRSFDLMGSLDTLARDVKFAIRTLRKSPSFTIVAVLTLALGIGANTAMFSVIYTVLLKPLPFPESDRIVIFESTHNDQPHDIFRLAGADYYDWESQAKSFSQLALASYWSTNITGIATPERVVGMGVSSQFFPLLGVNAQLGRTLTPADDRSGAPPVAVLSHSLWMRMFGGRPDILGQTLILNSQPTTVVGVMPADFAFPVTDAYLWMPLYENMKGVPRTSRFLMSVGRLKPGVTIRQAQTEMDLLSRNLERQYPDTNKGWAVQVVPAKEAMVGEMSSKLLVLFIAVGAVLLIACANVASLLLARMLNRERELAVRAALGATRWRLARQTITENLLLTGLGAFCALALAYPALQQMKRWYPAAIPRLQQATLSVPVLLFAMGMTLVVGLVLGLLAALRASEIDPVERLRAGAGTASHSKSHGRMRQALVVTQIAATVVLLIGGGLLIRSLTKVLTVDPGFRTDNVLTFSFWMLGPKYQQFSNQNTFVANSIEKVSRVPGVESVAAITQVPLSQAGRTTIKFQPVENPMSEADAPMADYRAISPGYFDTMGVSLLAGRPFSDADKEGAPRVVIVNQRLAKFIWPGQNAVGKQLRWTQKNYDVGPLTVVGVAGDVHAQQLETQDEPAIYVPYPQRNLQFLRWVSLAVRTKANPIPLWPEIRSQVLALDADRPMYDVKTTKVLVESSLAERKFNAWLLTGFAGLALLLSAIGIYGVISYAVSQRAKEFGIRMALGADAHDVMRIVLNSGVLLAVAGIAIGTFIAVFATTSLSQFLFGLGTHDPVTFLGVPLLLGIVAILSSYLPARRATKVSPMMAIREE
jgi:predicted permease